MRQSVCVARAACGKRLRDHLPAHHCTLIVHNMEKIFRKISKYPTRGTPMCDPVPGLAGTRAGPGAAQRNGRGRFTEPESAPKPPGRSRDTFGPAPRSRPCFPRICQCIFFRSYRKSVLGVLFVFFCEFARLHRFRGGLLPPSGNIFTMSIFQILHWQIFGKQGRDLKPGHHQAG